MAGIRLNQCIVVSTIIRFATCDFRLRRTSSSGVVKIRIGPSATSSWVATIGAVLEIVGQIITDVIGIVGVIGQIIVITRRCVTVDICNPGVPGGIRIRVTVARRN